MKSSVFGLSENVASAFAYALLFVSGIIVFVMEKENKTVRFHGLQSTVVFLALAVVRWVVGILPIIGGLLSWAVGLVIFVAWIFLMVMAYRGVMFKVPVIGDAVYEQVNK